MKETVRPDTEATTDAGHTLSFEKYRRRKRMRKLRIMTALVVILALLIAYFTGVFGASIAAAEDGIDTLRIALLAEGTYPLQTGISELYQVEELAGGFVALGAESCVVYAANGSRLRSIQPGYGRPAIAAGKTHFVIYNRSGTELRVESRLRTLYTKLFQNGILLCAIANGGQLAVATESARSVAELNIFLPEYEQPWNWTLTGTEGTPLRMEFASDNHRLAVATLTAENGAALSRLYVFDTRKNRNMTEIGSAAGSVPQSLTWLSSNEIAVAYDDHFSIYSVSDCTEKYRFDYTNETLTDVSVTSRGTALLFGTGGSSTVKLLSGKLTLEYEGSVSQARHITRTADAFYVLTDNAVDAFSLAGEYQWTLPTATKPQAVLDAKRLLLFAGNTAALLQPPADTSGDAVKTADDASDDAQDTAPPEAGQAAYPEAEPETQADSEAAAAT